jgi:hypothetical protein
MFLDYGVLEISRLGQVGVHLEMCFISIICAGIKLRWSNQVWTNTSGQH